MRGCSSPSTPSSTTTSWSRRARLIHELYDAGVDALIVQDMGMMELDIPPIEMHASTQTDIRTLDRAKFLAHAGFSQLVLARELNLAGNPRHRRRHRSLDRVLHPRRAVRGLLRAVQHLPRADRAQRQPRRLLAGLPPALHPQGRERRGSRLREAPAVDEGQQPERQPARAGRRRRALVQDRGALQGCRLREEHHRLLPPAPRRDPRGPPGPGPRLQRAHRALLRARPGQDLPPRQHRLLRQRPPGRHRRLRLAQLHRPAGRPGVERSASAT